MVSRPTPSSSGRASDSIAVTGGGRMGHIEESRLSYALPDGRPLLDDVSFRVG